MSHPKDPLPTVMSWPDADSGPWSVVVHWREIDGRTECIGLELWHGTKVGGAGFKGRVPQPITATAMRPLRPDALINTRAGV